MMARHREVINQESGNSDGQVCTVYLRDRHLKEKHIIQSSLSSYKWNEYLIMIHWMKVSELAISEGT